MTRGRLSRRASITALGLVILLAVGAVGYAVLRPTPRPMVIGVHVGLQAAWEPEDLVLFPLLANGNNWDQVVRRLVYNGLYRVNEERAPVEDLAARECTWTDDLLVISCDIRAAVFHDGSPLTADDVVFSYQLQASEACRRSFYCGGPDEAVAVDADTVEFRLHEPDATFLTFSLADTLIESKARITQAYDAFRAGAGAADPDDLAARSEALGDALVADGIEDTDCERLLPEASQAVLDLGLTPWSHDEFRLGPNGTFEPCAEAAYLARVLGDAAASLRLDGLDAIAAAYRILDVHAHPVGTGPWSVVEIVPGRSMTLAAFDSFHRGRPVTPQVVVRLIRSPEEAIEAVRRGDVDWLVQPFALEDEHFLIDAVAGVEGLIFNKYAYDFFVALFYNLRPGRLFEQPALRQAMELCINKPETVAAATRNRGIPLQASVMPGHWAFDENLRAPARDVPAAMGLIESAGWRLGSDGVYERAGRRLAATVPVHADRAGRLKFVQLVADQVAACGIELKPVEIPFDDFGAALSWPHMFPGEDEQWDVMFSGILTAADPGPDGESFACSSRPTPASPDLDNATGYCNPETDTVLAQARATYDVRERARLYRRHQQILAEQRPMLFGWAPTFIEVRSDDLTSTAGPLSTKSQTWWWQLETLAVMR